MSEQVVNSAPVANSPTPESADQSAESQETLESQEGEAEELDASEVEGEKEPKEAKKDSKKAKEIEKRIKKLKLKVDGQEIEEDFDMDDEDRLIRELQLSKMGQKRAQEKASLEKEITKFMQDLQKDPLALLQAELGMNTDELIEQYINKQIENAKKTPEQIEREKLEAELKSIRDEREKEKQTAKEQELARLQQQEFERYDMLMDQALTKSNLPRNPLYVKKIADYMLAAVEAGYDVTPDDVIPLVQQELQDDLTEMFKVLPEETIEKLLGDQVLNKLRKRRVQKAADAQKAVSKSSVQDTGKSSKTESDKPREKKSFKDFFGV